MESTKAIHNLRNEYFKAIQLVAFFIGAKRKVANTDKSKEVVEAAIYHKGRAVALAEALILVGGLDDDILVDQDIEELVAVRSYDS